MKKFIYLLVSFFLFTNLVVAADDIQFELETFDSCSQMQDTVSEYMKDVFKKQPVYPVFRTLEMVDDAIEADFGADESIAQSAKAVGGSAEDFSETNVQVQWVDESEIVKTDGKYVYYYNQDIHAIFVVDGYPATSSKVIKKIDLPDTVYNPVLYLRDDQLIVLANRSKAYENNGVRFFGRAAYYGWFDYNVQTVVAVYDISSPEEKVSIQKVYLFDGNLMRSRRIDDKLYVVSQRNIHIPYWTFYNNNVLDEDALDDDLERVFTKANFLPKISEIDPTADGEDGTFIKDGKRFPYDLDSSISTDCKDVSFILPNEETRDQYGVQPSFVTMSVIDLDDLDTPESNVIFGNISEIYMSLDNLYATTYIYSEEELDCPDGMVCIWPRFETKQNTLIHKFEIDDEDLDYMDSNIVPGNPLNQYSMDEYNWDFRVITQSWWPDQKTNLYILNKDLELEGSLEDIAPGETFQSSRYMGDKLYLVTFEQVDPLFVVDVGTASNPRILGELHMPGFSSYLHPMGSEDNGVQYLIGLGREVGENMWGRMSNKGIKVDVYKVDYKKRETLESKCGELWKVSSEEYDLCTASGVNSDNIRVEIAGSLSLGDNGSYSEALNNPRMFVYNTNTDLLYLPAVLYTKKDNSYENVSAWQGLLVLEVDENGVDEVERITHVDYNEVAAEREQQCAQYSRDDEPECRTLIGGEVVCDYTNEKTYIPEYCFADVPAEKYFADNIWKFHNRFINRVVYLDNGVYSLSNFGLQIHDSENDFEQLRSIRFRK